MGLKSKWTVSDLDTSCSKTEITSTTSNVTVKAVDRSTDAQMQQADRPKLVSAFQPEPSQKKKAPKQRKNKKPKQNKPFSFDDLEWKLVTDPTDDIVFDDDGAIACLEELDNVEVIREEGPGGTIIKFQVILHPHFIIKELKEKVQKVEPKEKEESNEVSTDVVEDIKEETKNKNKKKKKKKNDKNKRKREEGDEGENGEVSAVEQLNDIPKVNEEHSAKDFSGMQHRNCIVLYYLKKHFVCSLGSIQVGASVKKRNRKRWL
jgi:hypothetical protein